jgi:hypothetical protein
LFGRRRLTFLLTFLALICLCGTVVVLWQWKAPPFVRQRLEQLTGHHVTIGSVSLSHRLEIVAFDVSIAGSPPFQAQTLARAERVVVGLLGPAGFWSPSKVVLDGLDIAYLGSATGDNLSIPSSPASKAASLGKRSGPNLLPQIIARNVRLHGNFAAPYGPRIEFRVPLAEFERNADGMVRAALHHTVIDIAGWGSLRALTLTGEYDRTHLIVASAGNVALDVPGGGTLLENLALSATVSATSAEFEMRNNDALAKQILLSGRTTPEAIAITLSTQEVSLRALGALAANHAIGVQNAKASLHASLTMDRVGMRAGYEFEGKVQGIDLLHPAIDLAPWRNQALSLNLRGHADLASGHIEIDDGGLKALSVPLSLKGWVEILGAPRGSMVLFTPRQAPLACATLFAAQPIPVKQALSGLALDGKLGFTLALAFDASAWENLTLEVAMDPMCSVRHESSVLAALLPILRNPSANAPSGTKLALGTFHPDFVPLSQMPSHLPSAFLTSEDAKFYNHHGFDMDMIKHALAQDLENRSFDRGASTITQQLAKNLFLTHRRTLARKVEEAVLTWRLQKLLSKDRVLEIYLNIIELGPGIRGVKQAARVYFGKDVASLLPLESAHLAALTPNPHVLARRFRDGQVDEGWQQRLYDLLSMMKRHGRLSRAELAAARTSRLELRDLRQDGSTHGTP